MNYPSISRRSVPRRLPIAVGLTFSIAGLILAISASNVVHAESTQVQHNVMAGKSADAQTRHLETSIGREHRTREAELHKSGVAKKNPQRSNTRQKLDQEGKAGTGSFPDRNQGSQRKVRRALV